jgi:hypothetical protein
MDKSETEKLAPVDGERIHESFGMIQAMVGGCILATLIGAAITWAWWTEFPLYESREVRALTPQDQWQARTSRTVNGKEVFELPADPGRPVPVTTRHVLGFTYAVYGILMLILGSVGVVLGIGRLIHSTIQRPTLVIGENCFQLVVRDNLVRILIPYKNIREIGLVEHESTGKAMFVGLNLHDPYDPSMYYHDAARSKKWTGWDYAIGNKEVFTVPIPQIFDRLQRALTRGH